MWYEKGATRHLNTRNGLSLGSKGECKFKHNTVSQDIGDRFRCFVLPAATTLHITQTIIVGNNNFLIRKKQPGVVHIKRQGISNSVFSSSMAESLPTRLDDYCRVFKISFFDLKLQCVFCKHFVQLQDLADFYNKQLSLIWKGCLCYCSCRACLKLIAKFEIENHFQCSVKSQFFEDIVKQSIQDVIVRCMYCYKLLDCMEKVDCRSRNLDFALVRGHWRNCCRFCMKAI